MWKHAAAGRRTDFWLLLFFDAQMKQRRMETSLAGRDGGSLRRVFVLGRIVS
jgi:hypothetical protein